MGNPAIRLRHAVDLAIDANLQEAEKSKSEAIRRLKASRIAAHRMPSFPKPLQSDRPMKFLAGRDLATVKQNPISRDLPQPADRRRWRRALMLACCPSVRRKPSIARRI